MNICWEGNYEISTHGWVDTQTQSILKNYCKTSIGNNIMPHMWVAIHPLHLLHIIRTLVKNRSLSNTPATIWSAVSGWTKLHVETISLPTVWHKPQSPHCTQNRVLIKNLAQSEDRGAPGFSSIRIIENNGLLLVGLSSKAPDSRIGPPACDHLA